MSSREELLTAAEIADIVKTKPETIAAWTRKGLIPSLKIGRRCVRYRATEVFTAIEKLNAQNGGGK